MWNYVNNILCTALWYLAFYHYNEIVNITDFINQLCLFSLPVFLLTVLKVQTMISLAQLLSGLWQGNTFWQECVGEQNYS
jgi:hypothetical protein